MTKYFCDKCKREILESERNEQNYPHPGDVSVWAPRWDTKYLLYGKPTADLERGWGKFHLCPCCLDKLRDFLAS